MARRPARPISLSPKFSPYSNKENAYPPALSFRPASHRRVEHPAAAALAQKGAARVATKSTLVHFPLPLYQKLRLTAIAKDISLRQLARTVLEAWAQKHGGDPVQAAIPPPAVDSGEAKPLMYICPRRFTWRSSRLPWCTVSLSVGLF